MICISQVKQDHLVFETHLRHTECVNTIELHVLRFFFPHSQRTNVHSLPLVLTMWKESVCVCVEAAAGL